MLTKNDTIKTLYVNEFEVFMKKLNSWDDFEKGSCKCRYCEDIMSQLNLYALIPINNRIEYCCSKSCCISEFSEEVVYDGGN